MLFFSMQVLVCINLYSSRFRRVMVDFRYVRIPTLQKSQIDF